MARPITSGDVPLRETEEAAYHAFREWPVFLVMRQKELEAHQALLQPNAALPTPTEKPQLHNKLPDAVSAVTGQQEAQA